MPDQLTQLPLPLPESLKPWLILNNDYKVLVCYSASCRQAISPGAVSRHLRDKHQAKRELQKLAEEYIVQWQWPYDYQSVPLPPARSAPQLVLPIIDGYQCQECGFLTRNRKAIREHANKEHSKQRAKDNEILTPVRLQTWVGEKRARYWVVDESREVSYVSPHPNTI
jgi:hypothetical protein